VLRGVGLDFELPTAKSGSGIEVSPADIGFSFGSGDSTTDTGLDFGTDEPTTDEPTNDEPTTDEPTTDSDSCPQVWYDISNDLKRSFSGCNQLAANAIRFAFHDAGESATSDRTGANHG